MTAKTENRWTYAESGGLVHPVRPGQVWTVGDDHVYASYDFMSDAGHAKVESLVGICQPTLLYCDPPWGQGLINQFRTKAGLDAASYRWEDLYRRVVAYVEPHVPIWLESGKRERAKVLGEVLHEHVNVAVFDVHYYRHRGILPYVLRKILF